MRNRLLCLLTTALLLIAVITMTPLSAGAITLAFPTSSTILAEHWNKGAAIDFFVDNKSPVSAALDGTVVSVWSGCVNYNTGTPYRLCTAAGCKPSPNYTRNGFCQGGYGNGLVLSHGNNVYTAYAHMTSVSVAKGARVARGQQIGTVGSYGQSTTPHLHFEIRIGANSYDNRVQPIYYFKNDVPIDSPSEPTTAALETIGRIYADGITETDATIRTQFNKAYTTKRFGAWFGPDPNNMKYVDETYGAAHDKMYYNAQKWFGGCQPGTTYYYKFFADIGNTRYTSDLYSFTTPRTEPLQGRLEDISTSIYADGITQTDATIRAQFNQAYTTKLFGAWFGPDPNNMKYVEETYGPAHDKMYYNAQKWFEGCQPGTTYYYRFFADIGDTHFVSDLYQFDTLKPDPVITTETLTETSTIKFTQERRANDQMLTTEPERLVQAGVDGVMTKTILVTYQDGVETGRQTQSEVVTTAMVPEIVEYGTKPAPAGADSVRITSVNPNRFEAYELPVTFTVTMAYELYSQPKAVVILAFNSAKADSFTFGESSVQEVSAGEGTVTISAQATPRAWGTPNSPNGGFQGGLEAIAGDIFGALAVLTDSARQTKLAEHRVNLSKGKAEATLRGDANGDGSVNIKDITHVMDHLLDNSKPINAPANANMDGQGGVDIGDLQQIIALVVGP